MVYRIARFLQLAGLLILPVAMAGNMMERLDLKQMLGLCAIGVVAFSAGWLLQQSSKPR